MDHVSRRSLLGTVAAGVTATAAGCSSGVLGGSGDQQAAYEEWLAADVLDEMSSGLVFYADVQEVRTNWPDGVVSEFGFDSMSTSLGVAAEDLEGMLAFQTDGSDGIGGMGVVLTGSFDKETLVGNVSAGMETETHGDFEVVLGTIAISSDAVIIGDTYAALIDARNGDADRITDVDDTWDEAVGSVAGSGLSGVVVDSNEPFELMAIAMDADGSDVTLEARAHFADAETAESEKAAVEAEAESEFVENGEVQDIRVDGTVVIVEAVIRDFTW